jgi:type II secretory pathway component GspD/PulD (secretin)
MTRTTHVLALAALVGTLAAGSASAQDVLNKRLTLDLKAVPPAAFFDTVAATLGVRVSVDPAVTAPVDIVVKNVTAKTVLTAVCESVGCRWSLNAGTLVVKPGIVITDGMVRVTKKSAAVESVRVAMSTALPGDMKFENAPLSVVSERLSAALGIELTLTSEDPAVQTVTADLSHHTLQSGLRLLGEQAGAGRPMRIALKAKSAAGGAAPSIYIMFATKKAPAKK